MTRKVLLDPADRAAFTAQRQRFDFQLLLRGFVHQVADSESLARAGRILDRLGYVVHELDGGGWQDEGGLHDALAAELSFPGYYGRNLDALDDMLGDVAEFTYGSDPASSGTAVLVDNYDQVHNLSPWLATTVADVFCRAARYAAVVGHPFLVLLRSDADLGSVGGIHVRREGVPPEE
ncbi:barstar family protein [Pseudonocardia sp. NPDC046786]|uniref:barstar family protein n=1 Tax=Pseudonocardia sp. NPDC046786 TaxID=3155471 RepID=UPI0033FF586F